MDHLTGFELYICTAGRGNPANALACASDTPEVGGPWPRPAGLSLVLVGAEAQDPTILHSRPADGSIPSRLTKWAAVESMNAGSYMRAKCPPMPDVLGSGRWLAGDRGGLWRVLRDDVLSWMDLPQEARRAWERAAFALHIDRAALAEWGASDGRIWHDRLWRARAAAQRGDFDHPYVVVAEAEPADACRDASWLVWDGTRADNDPCGYGRLWVVEARPRGTVSVTELREGGKPPEQFENIFPVSVGPEKDEAWVIVKETGTLICP